MLGRSLIGMVEKGRRLRTNLIGRLISSGQLIMYPPGLHVVFLGADGSGKSSVINRVMGDLAPAFVGGTAYFHFRPRIWQKRIAGEPVADPYGRAPRSTSWGIAKLAYYLLDYTIGWWLLIWPKRLHSALIVFDRYYHDLLIDPRRYRFGGPMWLAEWTGKAVPRPDIWILLDVPAEVLQERKQEVAMEESARQRSAYLEFLKHARNGVVIDATAPLEQVVVSVDRAILSFVETQTRERLNRL